MLVWKAAAIENALLCFRGPLKLSTIEYGMAAEVGRTVVYCVYQLHRSRICMILTFNGSLACAGGHVSAIKTRLCFSVGSEAWREK